MAGEDTMNIEELKVLYKKRKTEAINERAKLEKMRKPFSAQCDKTADAEQIVAGLKECITDTFMRQEGLKP